MKPLRISESDTHRRRRQIVTYTAIALCFFASWADTEATQKTGDWCLLKTGDVGVCQPLTQCTTAVYKAVHGDMPIVCSIKEDMPIVCCGRSPTVRLQPEAHRNIIQKQNPPQFTSQYYLIDAETHEMPSADFPVRYSRGDGNEPWWLVEKPFAEPPSAALQKQQSSNNNNGNNNHHQGTSRPGNLHNHWWYSERPFTSAPPPPPPPPTSLPPPPSTPPKPITEPVQFTITRRGQVRVSETKCNEYAKLATSQIVALPLVPTPEPVHVDIPKCDFSSVPLIVGGEEAKFKEFPHMVALGYLENGSIDWKCGGSLISEYFVLTAAHCAPRNNPPTIARLGGLNLKASNEGVQPINYLVVEIIRHPDYKAPAKYNDIALLKLDRHVEFNEAIRPACLYTTDTFAVNKTVATGWGKIDYAEKKSDNLLKVVLSIIDNNLCNELYQSDGVTRQLKNGIVPSMMCAGELEGGKDTCQGDSGGPIQITRPDNQCTYSIIGVTSFGKFCAAKNAPGVYTRVSSFVPWIESTVWPEG